MSWWVSARILYCLALGYVAMAVISGGLSVAFEGSVAILLVSINAAILALRENKR